MLRRRYPTLRLLMIVSFLSSLVVIGGSASAGTANTTSTEVKGTFGNPLGLELSGALQGSAAARARIAQETLTVVASGLDNPRHLNFGPDGALYVAEAGRGGNTCVSPDPEESEFQYCYGWTGAITQQLVGKPLPLGPRRPLA